jgi:hypothetical protein
VQLQSASRNAQINEEVLENKIKGSNAIIDNKLVVIKQCLRGMLSAMGKKGN